MEEEKNGQQPVEEPVVAELAALGEQRNVVPEWVTLAMSQKTDVIDPVAWAQTRLLATNAIKAGAVPAGIRNPEQLMMIIQAGKEMGMEPVESMKSLYIVNGLINLYGAALGKRLRSLGYLITKYEDQDDACTVTVQSKDGSEKYEQKYTYAEAERSGFTKSRDGKLKQGWTPGALRVRKLRYGALSLLVHSYLPDALGSAAGIVEVSEDVQVQKEQKAGDQPSGVSNEAKEVAQQALQKRESAE